MFLAKEIFSMLLRLAWCARLYLVWCERNNRLHSKCTTHVAASIIRVYMTYPVNFLLLIVSKVAFGIWYKT